MFPAANFSFRSFFTLKKKIMFSSKLTIVFLVFLCLSNAVLGNCLLINKSFESRINSNTHIIEGQIIDQTPFWSNDNSIILTANRILIYKSFKGNIVNDEILLITEGGEIGNKMHIVEPNLDSKTGEVGLFFLTPAKANYKMADSDINANNQFVSQEESLGFVQYDIRKNIAFDTYSTYDNISENFYKRITQTSNTQYAELNTFKLAGIKNIDQNLKSTDINSDPSIYCFFPQYIGSGTESILSIDGNELGSYTGNASIAMISVGSNFGQHVMIPAENIISWTNENIQLIVPQKIGSGKIQITTSDNTTIHSDEEVTITFARSKTQGFLTHMINDNDLGGYTFKASTSTSYSGVNFATSGAFDAFERALLAVRKSGLNFIMDGTTSTNSVSDDDQNIVMFDNTNEPLTTALGKMYRQFSNCGAEWEMTGVDVKFKRASTGPEVIKWSFSESGPSSSQLDFQSIATHELLHGAQLKHSLNPDDVLFYIFSVGESRRSPVTCTDVAGLQYITEQSMDINALCGSANTYEYPPEFLGFESLGLNACSHSASCDPSTYNVGNDSISVDVLVLLEGFLNEDGQLNNGLATSNLIPFEHPFSEAPYNLASNASMNEYPAGIIDWVIIELRDRFNPSNVVVQKAVLIDEDGHLMETDGSRGVKFHPSLAGDYFIAIRHKTHLDILSADYISLSDGVTYDFTTNVNKAMGSGQLEELNGQYAMYAGDFDSNGNVNVNDYNKWRLNNAVINKYVTWDADGNGIINVLDYNL